MKCNLCEKDFGFKSEYLHIKDKFNYITCHNCQVGLLSPFPTPEEFQEKYNTEIYYDELSSKSKNRLADFLLNFRIYEFPWDFTLEYLQRGKALDVGCGNGEYLENLKNNSFEIYATDYSQIALDRTRKRTKTPKENYWLGDFSEINFPHKFDVISFWHVLEHVEKPMTYFKKSHELLNNGGYIVGEVPNYDSWVLKIFKQDYSWIMIPEHIIYYSYYSLDYALKEAGFTDIYIHNPNRAILNLSTSFKVWLDKKTKHPKLNNILFYASIFITLPVMIIFSLLNKGEVLRFVARKSANEKEKSS